MIHPGRYQSLGELLDDAVLTWPSELALIEAERDRENVRHTYASFHDEGLRVAAWLREQHLCDGARVAIVMGNQSRWLIAAWAILHVGGVIVPLDSRLEPSELEDLLAHSGAHGLFVDFAIWRRLNRGAEHVVVTGAPAGAELLAATRYDDLPHHPAAVPAGPRTRDDLACIVYSSGTGGAPKGCMLTHGNYLAQLEALQDMFTFERGDRYFSILPTNHAIDFMCGFIASFAGGATVVHQRTLRPEFIRATMQRYKVTQMAVVPLVLKAFERSIQDKLDPLEPRKRRVFDLLTSANRALTRKAPNHGLSRWLMKPVHDAFGGHLKLLFCGGAFTDAERARFFYDLGLPVVIGYGLTEVCTVATLNDLEPFRADTVGSPVLGVEVRIHDAGADGVGEVQLRGPTVFAGYLGDPERTEASFDGEWFRTGDLGWLDAAFHLHLVGRSKNMIVTPGGKNIYPEDIESTFEDAPCEELVVFAEDYVWPRRGLSGERLVAVVRPLPDADPADILDDIRQRNVRLPDFKRVSAVVPWTEPFPRTTSMKVKRSVLAEAIRAQIDRDATLGVP